MTNQSVITFFIILALMSATLFFNQIEKLNRIEAQPSINLTQIRDSINRFEGAAANYQKAVEVKKGSDFFRGALDLVLSPFSSIINLFLDSVMDIENEADQSIQQTSRVIDQYKNIGEQLKKTRRQQVNQIIVWRNIGFIFCLFSLSSALFARLPKTTKTQELLLTKETSSKKAFFCSVAGGIVSCLPYYSGLIFQLILPSLLVAYFIDYKHTQNQQNTWQKRVLKAIAFSLIVSTVIYGFYNGQGIMTGYAVSGFLFGLFVASVIQQTQLSLTTRQFFLIAFIFSIARLIAALSAAESGGRINYFRRVDWNCRIFMGDTNLCFLGSIS